MDKGLTIEKYKTIHDIFEGLMAVTGIADESELFAPEGDGTNTSIVERLCSSMQNSGQMRNTIRFNGCNKEKIKRTVCNYDASSFVKTYSSWLALYNALTNNGKDDNGKKRRDANETANNRKKDTNWEKYAKGIFAGIHYLVDKDKQGIEKVKELIKLSGKIEAISDEYLAVIEDITAQIPGMGIALTCDWLKESGCTWLVKPDTHIVEVYKYLTGKNETDNRNIERRVIIDMFDYAQLIKDKLDKSMTAYKLDKMIWLICTGDFYQKNIKIGRDLIIKRIQ